jgi:hypothetical protein
MIENCIHNAYVDNDSFLQFVFHEARKANWWVLFLYSSNQYKNFPKYVLTVTYVQTNTPVDVCFHRWFQ